MVLLYYLRVSRSLYHSFSYDCIHIGFDPATLCMFVFGTRPPIAAAELTLSCVLGSMDTIKYKVKKYLAFMFLILEFKFVKLTKCTYGGRFELSAIVRTLRQANGHDDY